LRLLRGSKEFLETGIGLLTNNVIILRHFFVDQVGVTQILEVFDADV
jgi:hypothetical protein